MIQTTTHTDTTRWHGKCGAGGVSVAFTGTAPVAGDVVTVDGEDFTIDTVDISEFKPIAWVDLATADNADEIIAAHAAAAAAEAAEADAQRQADRDRMIVAPRRATAAEVASQDAAADL